MDSSKQAETIKQQDPAQAPAEEVKKPQEVHARAEHFMAHPGPVMHENFANIPMEGTKEDRKAKAQELNK